jgi:tRNA pseudouridine55 synthase
VSRLNATAGSLRPQRPKRDVTGILLLDKPAGISSNLALQRVRRAYAAAKGGHTGNLDVAATGLLPLCFGEATKVSAFLLDADKTYVADVALGVTTSTGDREGEVLTRRPSAGIGRDDVEQALRGFLGEQAQVPPMYSALKRNGRPLYAYARAGIELERAARLITIHALRILDFAGDLLRLEVACSKGTYIRTLAEDLGEVLGCGAHLAALRRTRAGPFELEAAQAMGRFESLEADFAALDALLLPVDSALGHFPAVRLSGEAELLAISRGQRIGVPQASDGGLCRIYAPGGDFLGMGEIDASGTLAPRRMMQAVAGMAEAARSR